MPGGVKTPFEVFELNPVLTKFNRISLSLSMKRANQ
jgi:hypothetical protein